MLMKYCYPALSFLLVLALGIGGVCYPEAAWATLAEDQTPATQEEIDAALQDGSLPLGEDALGNNNASVLNNEISSLSSNSLVESSVDVQSFSGATMFETAIAEARAAYPQGSSSAILVGPGDAWVDALSAAGLAAIKGPILFTWQDRLQESTKVALRDMGVKSVIVVGGTAAVSDKVVSDLKSIGISLERRLAGSDCYDTQLAVFQYGLDIGCWSSDMTIFATGTGFGDALSISPVAYNKKAPIFLVDTSKGLRDSQKKALIAAAKKGYGKNPVVVGGVAAVSEFTVGFAEFASSLAKGSGACKRLAGATQYETSSSIAEWAVGSQGFSWNSAAFSTGTSPYDALGGSVLQGASKSVLLLVADSSPQTIQLVSKHASSIHAVRFFGGESAISMRIRMDIANELDFPYAAIPGFRVFIDAGHGWNDSNNGSYDPGAGGNGYQEANLTSELATMVGDILRNKYGVEVYVNNEGGWHILRHAKAIAQGCDAIASIHFNAGGGTGSESLIHNYNASYLSKVWQAQIHPPFIEGVGLTNRRMKVKEVAILGGYLPSTILEVCFIDNSHDMSVYASRKSEIAYKIAKGIVS